MSRPKTVTATPNKSGNGFKAGREYTFTQIRDLNVWETTVLADYRRVVSEDVLFEGSPSPHLRTQGHSKLNSETDTFTIIED